MAKDSRYVKARSLSNGEIYTIGISLLKKYPYKWELVLDDEVEKGMDDEIKEMDYFDLKAALADLDVPFKGNASKAELIQLYKGAKA